MASKVIRCILPLNVGGMHRSEACDKKYIRSKIKKELKIVKIKKENNKRK